MCLWQGGDRGEVNSGFKKRALIPADRQKDDHNELLRVLFLLVVVLLLRAVR